MTAEPAPIIVVSGPAGVGKSTVSALVAANFERSAHVPTDTLMGFVVSGWVDPWLAQADHQHEVICGVLAVACEQGSVLLHYVVLRADLATCWARACRRGDGRWPLESGTFAELHTKFANVGVFEPYVIDASGNSEDVAANVLTAFREGRIAVIREVSAGPDGERTG